MLLIIYYIWYDDVINNHDVMILWIIWSYIFRYDIDDHDMMMLLIIWYDDVIDNIISYNTAIDIYKLIYNHIIIIF